MPIIYRSNNHTILHNTEATIHRHSSTVKIVSQIMPKLKNVEKLGRFKELVNCFNPVLTSGFTKHRLVQASSHCVTDCLIEKIVPDNQYTGIYYDPMTIFLLRAATNCCQRLKMQLHFSLIYPVIDLNAEKKERINNGARVVNF